MSDTITSEEKQDILNRQLATDKQVNALTADVARVNKSVEDLVEQQKAFSQQQRDEHVATRNQIVALQDTIASSRAGAWPLVISVMGLVLVCMGGFATFVLLLVNPLRTDQERIEERFYGRLSQLPHDYNDFGRNTKAIEILERDLTALHSHYDGTRDELSYLTGRVQKIDDQLQAVDNGASRFWNKTKTNGQ
jgi:polyhydroxyalkanoate synthesis regulator phasin